MKSAFLWLGLSLSLELGVACLLGSNFQICHLLRNNGDQGEQVLSEAVPFLEGAAKRYNGLQPLIDKMEGRRRFFHSHLPFGLMPKGEKQSAAPSPYVVYVVRNPKDVAVSFYHHSCSKLNYEGSWDEFFELFVSGQVILAETTSRRWKERERERERGIGVRVSVRAIRWDTETSLIM